MKSNKGFTLIELAVVLAVIAVLAAILTPMVSNYIDQARAARAQAETAVLAEAIKLYQRDVGSYPIFNSGGSAISETYIGTGTGTTPTNASTLATTSLESFLNNNYLGKTVMSTTGLGKVSFRGPYIGNVDADPWSFKYVVTAQNLTSTATNWAFVASAGPDGSLGTSATQPRTGAFAASGDDIVTVIK